MRSYTKFLGIRTNDLGKLNKWTNFVAPSRAWPSQLIHRGPYDKVILPVNKMGPRMLANWSKQNGLPYLFLIRDNEHLAQATLAVFAELIEQRRERGQWTVGFNAGINCAIFAFSQQDDKDEVMSLYEAGPFSIYDLDT